MRCSHCKVGGKIGRTYHPDKTNFVDRKNKNVGRHVGIGAELKRTRRKSRKDS